MPKRVSEIQKKEISELFIDGNAIEKISTIFNFSKQTIIKQLKNILGEKEFNIINNERIRKTKVKNNLEKTKFTSNFENPEKITSLKSPNNSFSGKDLIAQEFFEIPPVTTNIDLDYQKDITSVPLSEAEFPEVLYLVVDKNIELETKLLKDFPEWSFLSDDDLNRKTIQVFSDQKSAKQSCSKNQKLIKVTNTKVFLIASENLKSKGISRIIFGDSLLSL